jgi:hypothetical protein
MSIVRLLRPLIAALPAAPALAQAPAAIPPAPPQPNVETPAAPEAPTLGRLFFTPEERARIDALRRRPPVTSTPPVAAAQPEHAPQVEPPKYLTLNGVVRRSDGATTVWLNDKPVRGRTTAEGIMVVPSARAGTPGDVTVRVPQTGQSVDLKVGQQLEVTSGRVQEGYRAPRVAAAPQAVQTPPEAAAPAAPARRTGRERDLLRDLLREMDGQESTPAPGSKPAPATPR